MRRRVFTLVISFVLLFVLNGCSSAPDAVGENSIKNDIACLDDTFYGSNMNFISFDIVKRQTNEDDKTDFVWVDFIAENENCRYIVSCKLSYSLYNEGWLIDNYEVLTNSMEYTNGPDPSKVLEHANAYMDQYYSNFSSRNKGTVELVDMSIQDTVCYCLFNHAEVMGPTDLLTLHWRFRTTCRLNEDGWTNGAWDGTMKKYAFDWKLEGEWRGSNGGEDFYLKVHSYNADEMTVDVEYSFGQLCSNGIETLYIVNHDFWDEEEREWALNADKQAHEGFIDLYPFGANYTDAGQGYGVLADSGNIHCWLEKIN